MRFHPIWHPRTPDATFRRSQFLNTLSYYYSLYAFADSDEAPFALSAHEARAALAEGEGGMERPVYAHPVKMEIPHPVAVPGFGLSPVGGRRLHFRLRTRRRHKFRPKLWKSHTKQHTNGGRPHD